MARAGPVPLLNVLMVMMMSQRQSDVVLHRSGRTQGKGVYTG